MGHLHSVHIVWTYPSDSSFHFLVYQSIFFITFHKNNNCIYFLFRTYVLMPSRPTIHISNYVVFSTHSLFIHFLTHWSSQSVSPLDLSVKWEAQCHSPKNYAEKILRIIFIHSFTHSSMALHPFVGSWPLLQIRNFFTQTVGILGWVISLSQGRYLNTRQHKHITNAHTVIHALSGQNNVSRHYFWREGDETKGNVLTN
jgi:hypothetical protein